MIPKYAKICRYIYLKQILKYVYEDIIMHKISGSLVCVKILEN